MYPAQTSLIPVQLALARFLEQGGNVFGNYPYWYLGTTPFRYLSGPVLPIFLVGLHRILPNFSLFEILFGVIGVCWVVGGMGVYWLVYSLHHPRSPFGPPRRCFTALLATFFYLFGPVVPFLFRFSDGLYLIAFSFLPYILILYAKFLQHRGHREKQKRRIEILLCLLITFVILLNTSIIPTLILGMAAIFLATTGWKRTEEKLKQSFLILFFAFLASTLWYAPGYWLVSLIGPSLAGKGRVEVIFQLSKLLPTALAFPLAIFSVRFFKKRHLLRDFCFYWLFIFGFLTLMRFISDPDFWLDWSSYGVEIQIGLALLGGLLLSRMSDMRMKANVKRIYANKNLPRFARQNLVSSLALGNERIIPFAVCCLFFVVWLFTTNKYVIGTFQREISQSVEYRIGEKLTEIIKPGEKVFLSGTTVFWLNAFFNIPQVRGGVDQGSMDPNWRKGVWEVREGTEIEKSIEWLKELNVSYLVVHTEESEEFYHDFSYPEKFEEAFSLKKIYDEAGDRIYRVLD